MHETINESIKVLVLFFKNQVKPMAFFWRGKRYDIDKVNLIHTAKKGDGKVYFFSVSDKANFYRLAYDSKTLNWELNEIYFDG